MSEAEKELEKKVNELDGIGEDDAGAIRDLENERDRLKHSRNQ